MFQTKEELETYLGQPRIECLECGRRLKKLGVHLRTIHGMDPDDYRAKYGIPYSVGLACAELSEAIRDQVAARTDPERMRQIQQLSREKRRHSPNRRMEDAPIIQQTAARVASAARKAMLQNQRINGPSTVKVEAAKKNLDKAAAKIAANGPSSKQREASSRNGRLWGPRSIDKMLASLGRSRVEHSPETIALLRAGRAKGDSWAKLSQRHGIPKTTIQRLCAPPPPTP